MVSGGGERGRAKKRGPAVVLKKRRAGWLAGCLRGKKLGGPRVLLAVGLCLALRLLSRGMRS